MKKVIGIFAAAIFLVSCTDYNQHKNFVNGVVVTEIRFNNGVFLQVDTTSDGVADIEARVRGLNVEESYMRGDSISVDVREEVSYANLILKK